MDWIQLTVVALWNLVCGVAIGWCIAKGTMKGSVLTDVFDRARNDIKNFNTFGGMHGLAKAQVRDENGERWIITVERAGQ